MRINDFLKLGFNINIVANIIMNVANEYKNGGIKNIFISGS